MVYYKTSYWICSNKDNIKTGEFVMEPPVLADDNKRKMGIDLSD